jgi:hypothetical protein
MPKSVRIVNGTKVLKIKTFPAMSVGRRTALDHPAQCPQCSSLYPDIHMMHYPGYDVIGVRCEHDWHRGPSYNPTDLQLTLEDKAWLKENHISAV